MRAFVPPILFACAITYVSAQAMLSPIVLPGMDEAHMVGVFPKLALPFDPGAGTGAGRTWNFTAIPEPTGRFVQPRSWNGRGAWALVPIPRSSGEAGMDHRSTVDTAASFGRISSTTRMWSHEGSGHIDFSWATYADLVRVKLVIIDSLLLRNEQITTTRYLWYAAGNGTPVLEISRQDGGGAPDASGVYAVVARYEELGMMARNGRRTETDAAKIFGRMRSGLLATTEGGSTGVPFAEEH